MSLHTIPAERAALTNRAFVFSNATALAIIAVLGVAYLFTHSISLLGAAAESVADWGMSALGWYGLRIAYKPPDATHRFGHGKLEPLLAFGQAQFLGIAGLYLAWSSATRFGQPATIDQPWIGVISLIIASAITGGLLLYQRQVIKKTGSLAVEADYLHYTNDLLINFAALASLAVQIFWSVPWLDAVCGLVIACYIIYTACAAGQRAGHMLLDRELPDGEREKIIAIVRAHSGVQGMHDLRTRISGYQTFIEFHLELTPSITLATAHTITEAVEQRLQAAYPGAAILVHQEPAGIHDARLDYLVAGYPDGRPPNETQLDLPGV